MSHRSLYGGDIEPVWKTLLWAFGFPAAFWALVYFGAPHLSNEDDPKPRNPYLAEVCNIGPDMLERCSTYDIRDGRP